MGHDDPETAEQVFDLLQPTEPRPVAARWRRGGMAASRMREAAAGAQRDTHTRIRALRLGREKVGDRHIDATDAARASGQLSGAVGPIIGLIPAMQELVQRLSAGLERIPHLVGEEAKKETLVHAARAALDLLQETHRDTSALLDRLLEERREVEAKAGPASNAATQADSRFRDELDLQWRVEDEMIEEIEVLSAGVDPDPHPIPAEDQEDELEEVEDPFLREALRSQRRGRQADYLAVSAPGGALDPSHRKALDWSRAGADTLPEAYRAAFRRSRAAAALTGLVTELGIQGEMVKVLGELNRTPGSPVRRHIIAETYPYLMGQLLGQWQEAGNLRKRLADTDAVVRALVGLVEKRILPYFAHLVLRAAAKQKGMVMPEKHEARYHTAINRILSQV